MEQKPFIDYYELMQISPNAEMETIQRVYRMLAARYHPDNPETADPDRFMLLNEGFGVLSNQESRGAYDMTYQTGRTQPMEVFNLKEFAMGISGENHRRMGILCLLYNRRRTDPDKPGMSLLDFEKLMSFPREHLIFTMWYLQSKGLLLIGEQSDFAISAEGVDYIEQHLPSNQILYKLLKAAETGTTHSADYKEELREDRSR
ncbi:MAG: J domain-containing protein [Bryobacteraceae bacterium]